MGHVGSIYPQFSSIPSMDPYWKEVRSEKRLLYDAGERIEPVARRHENKELFKE